MAKQEKFKGEFENDKIKEGEGMIVDDEYIYIGKIENSNMLKTLLNEIL